MATIDQWPEHRAKLQPGVAETDNPRAQAMADGVRDRTDGQIEVVLDAVLHVDLVAEGVETSEPAAFLRAVGVENGQGFLWSRALSAEELIACYQSEHASDDVPQTVDATPP